MTGILSKCLRFHWHYHGVMDRASGCYIKGGIAMSRLIDLSQEIYQGMFVYPGHLKTVIWEHHSHDETKNNFDGGFSYQSRVLLITDHGPTHVDALSHLDPNPEAPSIEKMPLDLFYGPASCIDVSHQQPQTYISAGDLDEGVTRSGVEVQRGDILLLYTATFNRFHGTREYLSQYPGLDEAGSMWRVGEAIKEVGGESANPGNPSGQAYTVSMIGRQQSASISDNLG